MNVNLSRNIRPNKEKKSSNILSHYIHKFVGLKRIVLRGNFQQKLIHLNSSSRSSSDIIKTIFINKTIQRDKRKNKKSILMMNLIKMRKIMIMMIKRRKVKGNMMMNLRRRMLIIIKIKLMKLRMKKMNRRRKIRVIIVMMLMILKMRKNRGKRNYFKIVRIILKMKNNKRMKRWIMRSMMEMILRMMMIMKLIDYY